MDITTLSPEELGNLRTETAAQGGPCRPAWRRWTSHAAVHADWRRPESRCDVQPHDVLCRAPATSNTPGCRYMGWRRPSSISRRHVTLS